MEPWFMIFGGVVLACASLVLFVVVGRGCPRLMTICAIAGAGIGYLADGIWCALFGAYVGLLIAGFIGAPLVRRRREREVVARGQELASRPARYAQAIVEGNLSEAYRLLRVGLHGR